MSALPADRLSPAPFLVCGLGALGQACLQRLLAFDLPLHGVDLRQPNWRDPELESRLAGTLTHGDMRLAHVLRQAGAERASAVLLLSADSTINFEAALQVRLLNPTAEIVVRSTSRLADLGALLEHRLPGVAVVDPILLCADAITTALRPTTMQASVEVDGQFIQLSDGPVQDLRHQKQVRLPGSPSGSPPVWLSARSPQLNRDALAPGQTRRHRAQAWLRSKLQKLRAWLRARTRLQRWAFALLILLVLAGVRIFSQVGGWKQGVFVTLGLLKGEYVDPVNLLLSDFTGIEEVSGWLIVGTLFYSLVGTLLTSALVAVILERLLRERLGVERIRLPRRGPAPVLLVEGSALARRIAQRLRRHQQLVVRIEPGGSDGSQDKGIVQFGQLEEALQALEGRPVSAVGLLSTDLLANLEAAMALQQRWPEAGIAVLAHDFGAAEPLGDLLGGLAVISTVDLVADAVVAAAFGERVEGVLQLQGSHLLIVRYRLEKRDNLCGLNISRLENGYGVTGVSLRRPRHLEPILLPPPELVLAAGDQLVVLATAASLRSIELGNPVPPRYRLQIQFQGVLSPERRFQAQQSLARWIGCLPGEVVHLLDGEKHLTPPVDREICDLLVDDLRRQGVDCFGPMAPPSASVAGRLSEAAG
ncbi:MAG: NAD-binding protein [Cyanobium sp. ELA507]